MKYISKRIYESSTTRRELKRCYQEVGWELKTGFALAGLSLGFDRRAEHVEGVSALLTQLGLSTHEPPTGIADRLVGQVPAALKLSHVDYKPRLGRRQSYPTALLTLLGTAGALTDAEVIRQCDLEFVSETGQRLHQPEHDLVTAWGADGFAVHTRGPRNIFLLTELYEALLARDVAVLAPTAPGAGAGSIRLVLASMMSDSEKAQLALADQAARELYHAAVDTGIYELLNKSGRSYRSLTPEWFDTAHDEVVFFLEPADFTLVNRGWFSLEELQAWAAGQGQLGPIVREPWLDHMATRPQYLHWESRLVQGLARIGAAPRYGAQLLWLDKPWGVPAFRYRATRETEHIMASGVYPFHAVIAQYLDTLPEDLRKDVASV